MQLPWRTKKNKKQRDDGTSLLLKARKVALGLVLALLCAVDSGAALIFIVTAANFWSAAGDISAEVRSELAADASSNATVLLVELTKERKARLSAARELEALAAITGILSAYICLLSVSTAIASRFTGSRTRLQKMASLLLRVSAYLLIPQACILGMLCCYGLVRGKLINEQMCAHGASSLEGCFSVSVRKLAGGFALLGVLALVRVFVTLKFNATVIETSDVYAEMGEMETAAEVEAREQRRTAITSKHQALRDKYKQRGIVKT
jgi:hypothetical protein